jgi:outer membrane protein insertion porin family
MRVLCSRAVFTALILVASMPATMFVGLGSGGMEARAQSAVRSIQVQGNRRVEPETVRSYMLISPGDFYDPYKVDESLKALFATGLFQDVDISLRGSTVVVTVVENPIINRVAFEGNREVGDDSLTTEVQSKQRAVFTRARVQSDVQRILDVYRRQGYYAVMVDPQIINLEHNRVDLVFVVTEGASTKVRGINFVGNDAFSDSQLREVITTSRSGLLSFFKTTNVYDPDRLNLDRELLRQHYMKSGYADARIVSAVADLDRDGRGFFITFTVEEGQRYRFGNIDIETSLASLDPARLKRVIETRTGRRYNVEKVDKTIENLTLEVAAQGYAFGRVTPRVERDEYGQTIGIVYVIEEGPRVYIERINIVGNYRTRDDVIRREFRLAEGDAYNRLLVDAAKRRLTMLQFFKSVEINNEPGSAPDRVILNVVVVEQPTGELSLGAGYSTNEGIIGDISIAERNLMGRGQYVRLRLSGSLERFQVDFSFTEPRFLGRNLAAGFDVFHKEVDFTRESSFRSRETGGGIRLGFPIVSDVQGQVRYQFIREQIFDVQPGASAFVRQSAGDTDVSLVGYTIAYDTRNNPRAPTQGIYAAFSQDFAGVGGDVNFLRSNADLRGYYPITNKITLVGRLQGGHIEGWDNTCGTSQTTGLLQDCDVRLVDLFFKGGETIRGFERAGIGPRDSVTKDALGGKIFAAATAEVRFPIPLVPENLGFTGAFFFDAATLYDPSSAASQVLAVDGATVLDSDEIRTSVGFSLIWASPLGPLRADFGHALTKAPFDETEVFRFGASTQF